MYKRAALTDRIEAALRAAGPGGLTRTQISKALAHNATHTEIVAALEILRMRGVADFDIEPTSGRPREVWFVAPAE